MKLVLLVIATVLSVFFLILAVKGKKYDSYVENLDSSEYPLAGLYPVGFALADIPLFAGRGKLYQDITAQARLIYIPMYVEYYSRLTWAMTLTFVYLFLTLGFVFAALFQSIFFAILGIAGAVVFGYYFGTSLKEKLKKRQEAAAAELPEIVSAMALLINSGMVLKEAWRKVAFGNEGEIYSLMQDACTDMENGLSEQDALYRFSGASNSPDVKKFTSSLVQSLDKGNRDLCDYLTSQSTEMWNTKKQTMLQKGEAASSKLLAPIAIIFLGVMFMVIAAAVGLLI